MPGRAGTLFCFLLAVVLTSTGRIVADPFSIEDFIRTSDAEFLHPRFDVAGGQTTTNTYSGFVEVLVTGFGQDDTSTDIFMDAFWKFTGSSNEPLAEAGFLTLGSERQILPSPGGRPFRPNSCLDFEAGALPLAILAVAYEGSSFLGAYGVAAPQFSLGHEYHLVINLLDYQGTLTLGFRDGGVFNNSSDTYNITLYQVVPKPPGRFVRGDANGDGSLDVSDPISTLLYLFTSATTPGCLDALDANDDGDVDIADPVGVLATLFAGGFSPREPFPSCGVDSSEDGLHCQSHDACVPE